MNATLSSWNLWMWVGLAGQASFSARFLVQWVMSEKKGRSVMPIPFWYLSLLGGLILTAYAIHIKDPVFVLGQSFGLIVYVRNLMLLNRGRSNAQEEKPAVATHQPILTTHSLDQDLR